MAQRVKPGELIRSTIEEIRCEKKDSLLWDDFMIDQAEVLNDLFDDYLINLAYKKLYGSEKILNQSVKELPVPPHARNILLKNKIETIRDLIQHSSIDLSHLPGFGQVSVNVIMDYLSKVGFKLAENQYRTI